MKKILALILAFASLILCLCGCQVSDSSNDEDANNHQTSLPEEMPEDFSFIVKWGLIGHYYNSETGELRKAYDDEYRTTHLMTEEELKAVYKLIYELNVESYDDILHPSEYSSMDPAFLIELTVHAEGVDKTIHAYATTGFDSGITERMKKYCKTVESITKMLTDSEEWKALPEWNYPIY